MQNLQEAMPPDSDVLLVDEFPEAQASEKKIETVDVSPLHRAVSFIRKTSAPQTIIDACLAKCIERLRAENNK